MGADSATARTALFAGSFDPVTRGHEDLVRRAFAFADRVVVAVATNASKQPLFTAEERTSLIREVLDDERVEVRDFRGLLVDLARDVGATMLVRGLRAVSDFDYEYQMALMNRHLLPTLETVFLVPSSGLTYVSSSLVREVARYGGNVDGLVHPRVADALRARFAR
jgi:pantetheine-phosphate adenylyltransferase